MQARHHQLRHEGAPRYCALLADTCLVLHFVHSACFTTPTSRGTLLRSKNGPVVLDGVHRAGNKHSACARKAQTHHPLHVCWPGLDITNEMSHLVPSYAVKKQTKAGVRVQEYEADYEWLMRVSQEDLIEDLRSKGRRQAATRQLRSKQQASLGAMPATQFEERQVRARSLCAGTFVLCAAYPCTARVCASYMRKCAVTLSPDFGRTAGTIHAFVIHATS